ncbi:hypothetical protein QVD17_37469 [Tagetes erecta]|uniref:Uncharacterized protein n=1 Tax=Tagetes erecta TaxID=13708 RepID=A0AAD8NJ76_TARER|nr:hypothetical protein QVD17_37469 [Tagetes erecta]
MPTNRVSLRYTKRSKSEKSGFKQTNLKFRVQMVRFCKTQVTTTARTLIPLSLLNLKRINGQRCAFLRPVFA